MDYSFDNQVLELSDFTKLFGHTPGAVSLSLKIALVGYPATGKTTFLRKFTDQVTPPTHIPSSTLDLASEVIRMPNGLVVEVFLYDVPGQTQYIELPKLFANRCHGVIYFFAHHYAYSFNRLEYLLKFTEKYFLGNCYKLIVGNQFSNRENEIQPYEAYEFAGQKGLDYIKIDLVNDSKVVDQCIAYFISKFIKEES
ncbi:unnamed protein product [Blepharisma stoltei]|uniref:Uncharacterized protein n=1 Tax=Blepharisma stoltei TaxID=1481888 RepID=A0AAU9JEA7_9CILI|nr:unnamed protein product [Blepharisma stoltei]